MKLPKIHTPLLILGAAVLVGAGLELGSEGARALISFFSELGVSEHVSDGHYESYHYYDYYNYDGRHTAV